MKKASLITAVILILSLLLTSCSNKDATDDTTTSVPAESGSTMSLFEQKSTKYADKGNPIAVIEMESGKCIVIELRPDAAPNTVNNFISLANSGFYDGLIFHRVIPQFMIQGGDPLGSGMGGPGYQIYGEFSANGFSNTLSHTRGAISMARKGSQTNPAAYYNTAGSQFFICVADRRSSLDGQYAVFGYVLEGMEVADDIVSVETDTSDKPVDDVVMKRIRVNTFGVEFDEPTTIK